MNPQFGISLRLQVANAKQVNMIPRLQIHRKLTNYMQVETVMRASVV